MSQTINDLHLKILEGAPASIHLLEINEQLEASIVYANNKYERESGILLHERQRMGFLDQSKIFHEDDAAEILNAFRRFVNHEASEESIIARFKRSFKHHRWCYIRSVRIELEPHKTHIIAILFLIDDQLVINPDKLSYYMAENKRLKSQLKLSQLTKAEFKVLALLGSGLSTKEVAETLCRSFDTVNNHRRSIFKKLDLHKISELVAFAKDTGLTQMS